MNFISTKISYQHKSNNFHGNEKLQKLLNIDFESTRRIQQLKRGANFRMKYPNVPHDDASPCIIPTNDDLSAPPMEECRYPVSGPQPRAPLDLQHFENPVEQTVDLLKTRRLVVHDRAQATHVHATGLCKGKNIP
jgi:hypothetical protein